MGHASRAAIGLYRCAPQARTCSSRNIDRRLGTGPTMSFFAGSRRYGASADKALELFRHLAVQIEPLEERRLLAQLVYVNDNWKLVTPGTLAIGAQVTDGGSITANY